MDTRTQLLSDAAATFEGVRRGDLADALDDLKRFMLDAVERAYERGLKDGRQ